MKDRTESRCPEARGTDAHRTEASHADTGRRPGPLGVALLAALLLMLNACGNKGPLVLPDASTDADQAAAPAVAPPPADSTDAAVDRSSDRPAEAPPTDPPAVPRAHD